MVVAEKNEEEDCSHNRPSSTRYKSICVMCTLIMLSHNWSAQLSSELCVGVLNFQVYCVGVIGICCKFWCSLEHDNCTKWCTLFLEMKWNEILCEEVKPHCASLLRIRGPPTRVLSQVEPCIWGMSGILENGFHDPRDFFTHFKAPGQKHHECKQATSYDFLFN